MPVDLEACFSRALRAGLLFSLLHQGAAAQDLPAEVAAFLDERTQCEHFLGEDPYDAERRAEIEAALVRFCRGTDGRLAHLKTRYREGPEAVMDRLNALDDRIE